jgi:hypothetical protein
MQPRASHVAWRAAPLCSTVALYLTMVVLATRGDGETLYFADVFRPDFSSGTIKSIKTDGTGLQTLVDVGGGLRSIAVDLVAGKVYWTDVDGPAIRRANLDGSGQENLVTAGLQWPRALVLDTGGSKMYWGDQVAGRVSSANLDGSNVTVVHSTDFHAGLVLDGVHGKLYWSTSIDDFNGDIVRCNLDGSNLETVVTQHNKPAYMAVDVDGGKIYWTDYVVDIVRRANLDGSNVEELYVVGANRNPDGIGLDLAAGKVYWGQITELFENISKLMRMNLDGSQPEDVTASDFGLIPDVTLGPTHSFARGDLNCDGVINFDDINAFVLALTDISGYLEQYPACNRNLADCNLDGYVDFNDINAFVAILSG